MQHVKSQTETRAYTSQLRQDQAQLTRSRILATARALFASTGYHQTSVRQLADSAGVSVKTLYDAIGSKSEILGALVLDVKDQIHIGDLTTRLYDEPDPRGKLGLSALVNRRFCEAGWEILELLSSAIPGDQRLAESWQETERHRLRGQRLVVDQLAEGGALRSGLSRRDATDTLWTLSSHDNYRALVVDRRRSPAYFERWLTDVSIRVLLEPS